MFSLFIDLKRNMFRYCAGENPLDTVLVGIDYDVSMHKGDSSNKRLEDYRFNCLLPKKCPSIFFFFFGR